MFAEPQQKNIVQQQSQERVRPKLEIGGKDDAQEKEANAIAGKVMRMEEDEETDAASGKINRMEDEEEKVQMMHDDGEEKIMKTGDEDEEKVMKANDDEEKVMKTGDEEEDKVSMKSEDEDEKKVMRLNDSGKGGPMGAPSHVESGIKESKGGGQSLPENVQKDIGGKMGADLSDVKIHTDSKAHEMSTDINAKAFTHGQDIYFKQGNYNPSSSSGKELLAHELVHTQQQKGGVQRKVQRSFLDDVKGGARKFWNFTLNTAKVIGNVMKQIQDVVLYRIFFEIAFKGGIVYGFLESLWDLVKVAFDLSIWKIAYDIFFGTLIEDAKELWKVITTVPPGELLAEIGASIVGDLKAYWKRMTSTDPWTAGLAWGWITGYIIAEILVAVLTVGEVTGIKWGAKILQWLGKFGAKILKYGTKALKLGSKALKLSVKTLNKGLVKTRKGLKKMWRFMRKSKAYDEALKGGRHSGFLKNYLSKSVAELEQGIASFTKEIEIHNNLIKNPEKFMKQYGKGDWLSLDPRQQKALLTKKWPSDIKRLTEQRDILEGILNSK